MIGVQRQLETGFEIKISTSNKAKLEAEIGKKAGDAEASSSKIEELSGSIATGEKDLSDATTIRKKEASDFAATETELTDFLDTLGRAINIASREMAKSLAAINIHFFVLCALSAFQFTIVYYAQ